MDANRLLHRILYKVLSLKGYLRVVSSLFFLSHKLRMGRYDEATEYTFHLDKLVKPGDLVIDIGANLGYYARLLAQCVGRKGFVYAVEPVAPIRQVLEWNLRGYTNVEVLPYALGAEEQQVTLGNATVHTAGYFGTGQNFVKQGQEATDVEFEAEMKRGTDLFAHLTRIDFIKCDVEGYEVVILEQMRPLLERFRPTVLCESGGDNRARVVELFTSLGYDAFTLEHGEEVTLTEQSHKDIIFRPQRRRMSR
jgi:FkbM family methyltransferase